MKTLFALLVLISTAALADKPASASVEPPTELGDIFESAGVHWRLAIGYRAMLDAEDDPAQTRSDGAALARVGPWTVWGPQSTRAAGDDALMVVWDDRGQRYGVLTGEVVAYTTPGMAGPQQFLPAGLGFERAFRRLGLTYYRLQGGDAVTVRRLAAMPGVLGAEAVIKTGLAIPHSMP